jgi:polar amino acid transport system substrate-binding protein
VLVGVLAATACGAAPTGPAAGTFTSSEPGVLVVAASLPARGFWEGTAEAPTGGFEYGLALELAERFGLDEVRVVDVPFDRLVSGDLGGADLALAELTPTLGRAARLDFSTPYLDAHPAVLVRVGTEVPDLAAARDLSWAVQADSIHVPLAEQRIRPAGGPLELPDIESVVAAVADGTVDAALLDLPTAVVQERLTNGALRVVAQFATDDAIAAAVPEGSGNLDAIDSAIRAMLRDGTIRALADEWLGRAIVDGSLDIALIRAKPVRP